MWGVFEKKDANTLETFLRGMETRRGVPGEREDTDLETFLRGMETPERYCTSNARPALKPSLEGWKHPHDQKL